MRDRFVQLGITKMSAGSRTSPGGYSQGDKDAGQFKVSDERTAAQVVAMLKHQGLEPVWKDWDRAFLNA